MATLPSHGLDEAMNVIDPDSAPHRRYTVSLRPSRGPVTTVRVVTNRGELKAVYLAALAQTGFLSRLRPLDVLVHDDGPVVLDSDGLPVLEGCAFDREEW